jgi:hypothetical protein
MSQKVMTAPLAVIKVNGVAIGKMKNIRVTENIQRGSVQGIGALNPSEIPAIKWDGTLNCSFYAIKFNNQDELSKNALLRNVNTTQEFVDTVLLQEEGVTIDILKKVKDVVLPSGVIQPKYETFASIVGCFPTREGFDISEGQISGKDADFQYINPILFTE